MENVVYSVETTYSSGTNVCYEGNALYRDRESAEKMRDWILSKSEEMGEYSFLGKIVDCKIVERMIL